MLLGLRENYSLLEKSFKKIHFASTIYLLLQTWRRKKCLKCKVKVQNTVIWRQINNRCKKVLSTALVKLPCNSHNNVYYLKTIIIFIDKSNNYLSPILNKGIVFYYGNEGVIRKSLCPSRTYSIIRKKEHIKKRHMLIKSYICELPKK